MTYRVLIFAFSLVLISCASSNSYYKKGQKLQQAGLAQEAADFYFISVQKNPNNVNAKIALKQSGQDQLNGMYQKFYTAHGLEKHADAVRTYREAKAYQEKISTYVNLEAPPYYEEYFNESKDVFLRTQYAKASSLIEKSEYEEAQPMLQEIVEIDPNYEDAAELLLYADLEPRYKKAIQEFEAEQYIKAHEIFEKILRISSNYKEARYYRDKCIEKGRITVAMLPVGTDAGQEKHAEVMYSSTLGQLLKERDPFLVFIDRKNMDAIIEEQKLGMSGIIDDNTVAEAGKLLGAKVVINSRLIAYNHQFVSPKTTKEIGYERKTTRVYDKVKKYYYNQDQFYKTSYQKTSGYRKVSFQFVVTMVSSETGEILYSNTFDVKEEDNLTYGSYDKSLSALYPGNATEVFTAAKDKQALDRIMRERRRSLSSEKGLIQKVSIGIGKELTREVGKLKDGN